MMIVQACISEQRLRDYLLRQLSEQESEQLETHLRQCAACEETAANLEVDDTLAGHLRRVSEPPSTPVDERLAASAERIKQMVPLTQDSLTQDSGERGRTGESSGDTDAAGPLGSYELLERIGRGGMGAVYRGRHRRLDRMVAIKLLPARYAKDREAIARFQHEMRAVGRLHHPSIITATDAGEHHGTHFLVMELVDGLDLARIARALGPLPIAEACELIRQAALGLEYVHAQGVVHRDIKPSNLMLDRQGRVKILDLGLAQLGPWQQGVDEHTTVGQLIGTLDYMAPEQSDSGRRADYRSDLFSLGATLYRLLCGRAPYAITPHLSPLEKLRLLASSDPPKLATLRPDAPRELCELVDQMLCRIPDDRPAGAAIVAQRLEPWCAAVATTALLEQALERVADEPPEPDEPGEEERFVPAALATAGGGRRRRGWKSLVATAALVPLLILGGVLVVLQTDKGQIVIESDAADVQVRLLRDGELVEDLTVHPGATASRVRAGNYEVIIDQGSDALVVSGNTFTLRRGETVVTRITRREPEAPIADLRTDAAVPESATPSKTYQGKTLDEWLAIFQRERAPAELGAARQAIETLADRESGQKVSNVLLQTARQLPPSAQVAGSAVNDRLIFTLVRKLLTPQAAMETLLEQLAIDDPAWQLRILNELQRWTDSEDHPDSLEPLVERVAQLALGQDRRLAWAATVQLPAFAAAQNQRGESSEAAIDALQRALDVEPEVDAFFARRVVDRTWPEPLQRIYLRWSIDQLIAAENVDEEAMMRALVNISVNVPLAVELSPDLPQVIATKLAVRANPLPGDDDWRSLPQPFAEPAFSMIAEAMQMHDDIASHGIPKPNHIHLSPAMLLASLAIHPALRTEDGTRILREIVDRLPDRTRRDVRSPRMLGAILFSSREVHKELRLLPLYLISRRAVEDAEVTAPEEETTSPTR